MPLGVIKQGSTESALQKNKTGHKKRQGLCDPAFNRMLESAIHSSC